MDGERIAIGSHSYLQHTVTLGEVKSLPHQEAVYCLCVKTTGFLPLCTTVNEERTWLLQVTYCRS